MSSRQLNRRTMLTVIGIGGVEALLAACGRSTGAPTVITSTSTSTINAVPSAGAAGGAVSVASSPTSAATNGAQAAPLACTAPVDRSPDRCASPSAALSA